MNGDGDEDDEEEHLLTGEERLKRAISAPMLSQLLQNTERQVNDDIKTSGVDVRVLVRVIYEDEFMQRTCRFIPVTLLFMFLFMIFFQLHYLTTYTFLQEQNIRASFTDAAADVATVGDVFAWMNGSMVPALWSARNIEASGSDISSMGKNVLVGGVILRTAQGPEVECQAPFEDWEGCYPASSLGGVEEQRVISKHPKYNGWESMQETSSLVRRLRGEEAYWHRLADQSLPVAQRRLEGSWLQDLFYRGSADPGEEEEGHRFEPEELPRVERKHQHQREVVNRVSGKGTPIRRVTGPFSNWARRGKKKRTTPSKTARRLKSMDNKEMNAVAPDFSGTFNVYQKVLPVSLTQEEVQNKLSAWAQATGEGTQLLSKSTLFLTCEAILKNDDIGNGLTTQVFVHFVFSRGGHIYNAVEMRSMTQRNSLMALGVLFLWVVLMLGFTFYTPFRAFSALKHGACLAHFLRFSNFFEWVILIWGWVILASLFQSFVMNSQFLDDYDKYLEMRDQADLRTLVEFDESWLRRFSLQVREFGGLDNQLVTAVAMYHLVLIFRFLVASRGQRRLALVVNTIIQGFEDIMHLTVVLLLMILAYVFSGHILFGARMQDFSTVWGSWGYVFQIVGQREYQWDDLIAGHNSIIVMIWLWSLFLVVILVVLNLVLAMVFDSYNEVRTSVTDKDTIWHTGLRLFYQLQSLSTWTTHQEIRGRLYNWSKEHKEDKVDMYKLRAICPKMPSAQLDLLFEDCQNRIKSTVERGRKNMLSEAIASILLGTEELRRGVRMMKDWRQGVSYFDGPGDVLEGDVSGEQFSGSGSLKVEPTQSPKTAEKEVLDSPCESNETPADPKAMPSEAPFWVSSGLMRHLRASSQHMENMYIDISQIEATIAKLKEEHNVPEQPESAPSVDMFFSKRKPEEPVRQVRRESKVLQPPRASRISSRISSRQSSPRNSRVSLSSAQPPFRLA
ncbi:unnamed protein product [Prorocentrum cordatum]|uniref:Polycystin cation channel PKD1/PKD2 domain-containing protein n=1 Tax=Prorocentrum cordatum TaxID=2364126 RepID=A0ABN9USF2_9DINO|nr:unnamed protein product [Polarella glacialis]